MLLLVVWGLGGAVASADELADLQQAVERQAKLLRTLQGIVAQQSVKLQELETALPPQDLLDNLMRSLKDLETQQASLESRIAALEAQQDASAVSTDWAVLLQSLLLLQSGNPEAAAEASRPLLNNTAAQVPRPELLAALGHALLFAGKERQASYYLGTLIKNHPDSPLVPVALYELGVAFGNLGDRDKQVVVWQQLQTAFPNHELSRTLVLPPASRR